MAKFRRGVAVVTSELYDELKTKLHRPSDDRKVMREYKIGASTCRTIRNTADYSEYRERIDRRREKDKATRQLESIVRDAAYDREMPDVTITTEAEPSLAARVAGLFLLICLLLIALGITYATLKWAFGF